MADIGDLNQVIRDDPINDTIGISGGQKRPVALKGIEHSRSHLGKVAEEFKFTDNLILDCRRKGFQFFFSPREKFNPSWHVSPVWP